MMKGVTATVGETLSLGENLRITVLEIRGSQALLGIQGMDGKAGTDFNPADDTSGPGPRLPLISGRLFNPD